MPGRQVIQKIPSRTRADACVKSPLGEPVTGGGKREAGGRGTVDRGQGTVDGGRGTGDGGRWTGDGGRGTMGWHVSSAVVDLGPLVGFPITSCFVDRSHQSVSRARLDFNVARGDRIP